MALDTYTNLKSAIADWLHRSDLTSQIPDFITLVEATVNNGDDAMKIPGLRTAAQETAWTSASTVPAVTVANSQYVTLPSDFLEMRRLMIYYTSGIRRELKPATIRPMTGTDRAQVAAIPERYSIIGNRLYLDPIPNAAFALEADYYAGVPALATAVGGVNWLLALSPQVYLFGACTYASPWLMADKRAGMWANGFASAVRGIQRMDTRKRFDQVELKADVPVRSNNAFNIISG